MTEKKFIAIFKIYNGESTYTMPVKTERKDMKQALKDFNEYVCDTDVEIWKLISVTEIKTFDELWSCI